MQKQVKRWENENGTPDSFYNKNHLIYLAKYCNKEDSSPYLTTGLGSIGDGRKKNITSRALKNTSTKVINIPTRPLFMKHTLR